MQKEQNLVIKLILISFIFLTTTSFSQTEEEDYLILNDIIEHQFTQKDSIVGIKKYRNITKDRLSHLYSHYYLKKNVIRVIGVKYDKDGKKSPDHYTPEYQNQYQKRRFSMYDTLPKLLTKKDFEILLKSNDSTHWDNNKILSKRIKVKSNKKLKIRKYIFVSKPYYSLDGKYAYIQISKKRFNPDITVLIYEKEDEKWKMLIEIN